MSIEEYEKVCDFVDILQQEKDKKIKIIFQEQISYIVKTKEFYKIKRCMAGINFMTILSN
jgi:hypothetical protein